ncbi:poly alpha-glucosyltransferase [Acinetobacter junii]|uniref:poly alpha-glucosyltransferase n=1 Tax=Acinetobacter junii TaxID=40215 RepID=UPI000C1B5D9D|nr:poly alpha-glucosyltransferase [Acinetobacter junii]ATU46028.1 poly alpha-glucosyltransferase [Acinetobacter junii]
MIVTSNEEFKHLKKQIKEYFERIARHTNMSKTVLFYSYGDRENRCQVWNSSYSELNNALNELFEILDHQFAINQQLNEYIKIDCAYNIQKEDWQKIDQAIKTQQHNNHYRKGLSFDEKFSICFLEQELYGRAIIRGLSYDQPNYFDQDNLNSTLEYKYSNQNTSIQFKQLEYAWTFDTYAVFYENGQLIPLQSQFTENGVRYLTTDKKTHIKDIIKKNASFLSSQIAQDGKYNYGFFPAYDRSIRSYNTVRHCTTTYSLLETLIIDKNDSVLGRCKLAIEYALQHFYVEIQPNQAYMLDGATPEDLDEIKLGANAAALLMLTKYQEITGETTYLNQALALAKGIQSMMNSEGETSHVLHYPSLELKEKFRIIYYDGEAALALLRLYQLHSNEHLLNSVKLMFERFIQEKYERYHDHWLSYCTNELTKICAEEKYFLFGIKNYVRHMIFIRNRKTTYSTLLEMMMSAYLMVNRIKELGLNDILEKAHFEDLKKLIEFRAEFQRTGFFYPEVAMYMACPEKVLHAFYVRHDRFRVRIDDQEHNLSGYIAYVQHFN